MTADDDLRMHSCKDGEEALFRRQTRENFRVIARRSVAEQDLSQFANLHAKHYRPAFDHALVFLAKLPRLPANDFSNLFWKCRALGACQLCKHRGLAIASDKTNWSLDVQQAREGFNWHRPWKHVASHHDQVCAGGTNFMQHCF